MLRIEKNGVGFWVCGICQGGYRDDEPCFSIRAGNVTDNGEVKYNMGAEGMCGDCTIDMIRGRSDR